MAVELRVPSVGESITEVQVGDWLVDKGQSASRDEPLVVIETDKVTVELPAPMSGKVTEILIDSGATAKVGDLLGYFEEGEVEAASEAVNSAPAEQEAPVAAPSDTGRAAHVMPAAARAAHDAGLDARQVSPSGPGGRILKEDVQRAAAQPSAQPGAQAQHGATSSSPAPTGDREEELVPLTPLRKRIAERLVSAQRNAAILTTFNEIDMTAIKALRAKHQEAFVKRYGIKLGFMSFFVKASVEALKRIPQVNAEFREDSVLYRNYHDVGIAVGGGKGLVVPILRDAARLSLAEVEQQIADFGKRARDNKITIDELTGGTFTISNGGIYGSLLSTPILNPPQSGILGLHAIQDRPMAIDGQVVIRPMMYVALSYDHRIVDGREAVTFLKTIKEALEDPARILLEI